MRGDAEPRAGTQHTSSGAPGARLADPYAIAIPAGTAAPFTIEVGMYDPTTGKRLAATGPEVRGGDHVLVTLGDLSPDLSPARGEERQQ